MKSLCIFLLMAVSLSSFAGGTAGNGGVSVVCRDTKGNITSAELLDIYEGREVHALKIPNEDVGMDTRIQFVQLKLVRNSQFLTKFQDELALAQANTVFISKGNELEPTNDAFPVIRRKGCKFEQLANYTNDGNLLISQEIYDELDNNNKAALYIHEAVYSIRRKVGDTNSQKSRRLVAHLMASNGDRAIIDSLISQVKPTPTIPMLKPGFYAWSLNHAHAGPGTFAKVEVDGNDYIVTEYEGTRIESIHRYVLTTEKNTYTNHYRNIYVDDSLRSFYWTNKANGQYIGSFVKIK